MRAARLTWDPDEFCIAERPCGRQNGENQEILGDEQIGINLLQCADLLLPHLGGLLPASVRLHWNTLKMRACQKVSRYQFYLSGISVPYN